MPGTDVHPADAQLQAFTLGALDGASWASVETHLTDCPSCQARAAGAPSDTLVELLRSAHARPTVSEDTPAPAIDAGTILWSPTDPAAPSAPVELAGHARYRLLRQLGAGGMGAVWLAEHSVMGRQVALKVIRPEHLARPGAAERFRREVQAAACLHHPNIVTAHDADQAGATHFLVMEYVEGVSLAEHLERTGPLPVAETCRLARDAALGLQHAHEHGLVHRDVKPHNIMLTTGGGVKVLDFGLAALAAGPEDASRLTGVNMVVGTPDYIAPEQAEDAHVADIRSDVYSLGCTLYHMLAGRVPFPGDSTLRKLDAHRTQPPAPIRSLRPDVPPELAVVLAKMMTKDPAHRYQTPAEVAAALTPFTGQGVFRSRRRRWPLAVAAAVLFAGLAAAAVAVYRVETDKGQLVITTVSDDVEVVIKQNGKEVRVIDTKTDRSITLWSGEYELELKDAGAGLKLNIDKATLTRGETVLAKIERVAKSTPTENIDGDRTYRTNGMAVHAVAVSPDGRLIAAGGGVWLAQTGWAVGRDLDVRLVDRGTGKELHRLKGPTSHVTALAFSPDGKLLVAGSADQCAYVWDVASGNLLHTLCGFHGIPPVGDTGVVTAVAFFPDGKRLLTMSWDRTIRVWDAASGKEVGQIGAAPGVATEWQAVAFLPGGKEAVVAGRARLAVLDLEADKVVRTFDWPGGRVADVSLSPDGKRLLTTGADGTDQRVRLWDAATGKLVRVFDNLTEAFGEGGEKFFFNGKLVRVFDNLTGGKVAFLPDGRRFLMTNGKELCLADADTGAVLETFRGHEDAVMAFALVPTGPYFVSGSLDQTVRLWRLPDPPAAKDHP